MKHRSGDTGPTPKTVCVRFATSSGQRVQPTTSAASTVNAVVRPAGVVGTSNPVAAVANKVAVRTAAGAAGTSGWGTGFLGSADASTSGVIGATPATCGSAGT